MDYNEYIAQAHKASELVDKGDVDAGMEIFKKITQSDLATFDRAVMSVNVASLYEKKKDFDQALIWYGSGVDLESRHHGHFVYEQRAAFLARIGRFQESLVYYEQLLQRPTLT